MKIYTRTGDDGTTSLAGGERVDKGSDRIEAYGTVDELIAWIGLLRSLPELSEKEGSLLSIQDNLMHCAAILASGKGAEIEKIVPPGDEDIALLESGIDDMERSLKPLNSFLLPGGQNSIANIHIARCVCRRTERAILRISESDKINPGVVKYINRLSDYLFVLGRKVASDAGFEETIWNP